MRTDLENIEDVQDRRADEGAIERPVPVTCWGKDHWSTFAFVAHWCSHFGREGFDIESKRQLMRCDPARHPGHAHIAWEKDNPTILKRGLRLPQHDDWDCLDDVELSGLVKVEGTGMFPIVRITDEGLAMAALLTAHKTRGGSFGDFEVSA